MRVLIGIDDTDNLESRGTGHRARQLSEALHARGLAHPLAITRHQLLVSPEIPYTSHNSSACLLMEMDEAAFDGAVQFCRDFLLAESAEGSDAGLCAAACERVGEDVRRFGRAAKQVVLQQSDAAALAAGAEIYLEGLTGTHGGIIGALAAVGLRAGGNDGRFLWLPGLREAAGVCTVEQLRAAAGIDEARTLDGRLLPPSAQIHLADWTRPVLRDGKSVLLIEEVSQNGTHEWRVVAKEAVKQLSQ